MIEPIDARLADMLDAFTVPDLSADFADRVQARAMTERVGGSPKTRSPSRKGPRRNRWGRAVVIGTGLLATGMLSVSAAAMGYLGEPIRQVVSQTIHRVPVVDHALHRIFPHHATRLSHRGDRLPVKKPTEYVRGEVTAVNPTAAPMFVSPVGIQPVAVGRQFGFDGAPGMRERMRLALERHHRGLMVRTLPRPLIPHFTMRGQRVAAAIAGAERLALPMPSQAMSPPVMATPPPEAVGPNMVYPKPARIKAYQALMPEEQAARHHQRQQWLIQHPQERQQWLLKHPGWERWWTRHGGGASVQLPDEGTAGQDRSITVRKPKAEERGMASERSQGDRIGVQETEPRADRGQHTPPAVVRAIHRPSRGRLFRRRGMG